jgi:hypothetical protein
MGQHATIGIIQIGVLRKLLRGSENGGQPVKHHPLNLKRNSFDECRRSNTRSTNPSKVTFIYGFILYKLRYIHGVFLISTVYILGIYCSGTVVQTYFASLLQYLLFYRRFFKCAVCISLYTQRKTRICTVSIINRTLFCELL